MFSVDYTALTRQDSGEKETFSVETLFGFGERQRKSFFGTKNKLSINLSLEDYLPLTRRKQRWSE